MAVAVVLSSSAFAVGSDAGLPVMGGAIAFTGAVVAPASPTGGVLSFGAIAGAAAGAGSGSGQPPAVVVSCN